MREVDSDEHGCDSLQPYSYVESSGSLKCTGTSDLKYQPKEPKFCPNNKESRGREVKSFVNWNDFECFRTTIIKMSVQLDQYQVRGCFIYLQGMYSHTLR